MYKVLEMIWTSFCLLFVVGIFVGALWAISSGALDCKPGADPACVAHQRK